jgi:hypothetical protein
MKRLLVFLLISGLAVSCSEDRIKLINLSQYQFVKPNLKDLGNKNIDTEIFEVNNSSQELMTTKNGNQISIRKVVLKTKDGGNVDYPYTVFYTEYLTPKDYILNNLTTLSDGKVLETAGVYQVKVIKDGQELQLKPNQTYRLALFNAIVSDPDMRLFGQTFVNQDSTQLNWLLNDEPKSIFPIVNNQGGVPRETPKYFVFPSSFGFINVDKFLDYDGKVTSNVNFTSENPSIDKIWLYLFFRKTNSIMPVYIGKTFPLPLNEIVEVIAVSVTKEGEFFSYFNEITISEGLEVKIVLTPIDQLDFQKKLDGLEFPNKD